ncbi:hypothetical protein ACFLYH_02410 [Candidatus Dependentiae bacterium]
MIIQKAVSKIYRSINFRIINPLKQKKRYFQGVYFFRKQLKKFIDQHFTENKESVVVWETGGCDLIFKKNAIIAQALKLRGYKTYFVVCDGLSVACSCREVRGEFNIKKWKQSCEYCLKRMLEIGYKYDVPVLKSSSFISEKLKKQSYEFAMETDLSMLQNYEIDSVNLGNIAWMSTVRYMQGNLTQFEDMMVDEIRIYRLYFYAAVINFYVAKNILREHCPISSLTSHGVYVDYAPAFLLANKLGINSFAWNSSYEKFKHYFFNPKKLNRGISDELWNEFKVNKLGKTKASLLDNFIKNRYANKSAADIYVTNNIVDEKSLKCKLGIKNNNPIAVLFTHINWDAALDISSSIFESVNDWILESISKMMSLDNINWIIRIHPAEMVHKGVFTVDDLIAKHFCDLPDYIKVINSDSDINSYGLYSLLDVAITLCGTVGVEVPLLGKNVITCSYAHYTRKGFTVDARSKEEYFDYLTDLRKIKPLSMEQIDLARKYAYLYFVARQIPLSVINKKQGHWGDIDLNKLENLLPGKDPILDKLCDGIIKGEDIILDEECLKYWDRVKDL